MEYLNNNLDQLDEDSKRRLNKNPLRILDSKNPDMQELIKKAPILLDFLNESSKEHFVGLQEELKALGVEFFVNFRIVRGLDYYNSTVYEWTTDKLGAQSAVCAGGRYDGLSEMLGGSYSFGVGFSLGLERVILLLQELNIKAQKKLDCYLVTVGDDACAKALAIGEQLRKVAPSISLMTNMCGGSLKSQFKRADKSNAQVALILGDEEIKNGTLGIKYLREDKEQVNVAMEDIAEFLGGL